MISDEIIRKFMALYVGNKRSYGQHNPRLPSHAQNATVSESYNEEIVRSHLEGEMGLGLVAIMDDDNCWFAVIDIDIHGPNKQDIDVMAVEARVARQKLPLVVCRSKSGGAHCYAFFTGPTPAATVRVLMAAWAADLGFPSAEIFPKQHTLGSGHPIDRPKGNWINLPYYDADRTERFAVDGGKQVSLEYFLELSEGKRVDPASVKRTHDADYERGPPCLQRMLESKVDEGGRNIAMFQAGVFLKRAYPEEWRPKFADFNQKALGSPLDTREIRTLAGSIYRKDYQYKCREEPCKSLCNRELCRTREFGITGSDDVANEIPIFEAVEKIIATPIRWGITLKGKTIEVSTHQLFNYEEIRKAIGESLHVVLPRMKNDEWDQYLREIMSKVTERREATIEDTLFERLCEYLKRVTKDKERSEADRRDDLKRGRPALIGIAGVGFSAGKAQLTDRTWYYAFKLVDFVEYLKRKRALPIPEHQVYSVLYRALGDEAKRSKVRIGDDDSVNNIWCIPEEWVVTEAIPAKTYKADF